MKDAYRGMHINTPNTNKGAWFVKLMGEGALDDGGLFRESLTVICIELQSTALPLLMPCGNQKALVGDNRDKWVINPAATTDAQMKMWKFLGALIGLSLRSGILLSLDLAPIFWKKLAGENITDNDLKEIETNMFNNFETYRNRKAKGKSLDKFELTMQTHLSNGDYVELVPGGDKIKVTHDNLEDFIRKTIDMRLNEGKKQIKYMKKGIDKIFKSSFLTFLSWKDLEQKVVGNPTIDLEHFKEITSYKNCSVTHEVVKRFWKVFESFNETEKIKYLRFVWGRTRLPLRGDEDVQQHTIELREDKG